MAATCKSMKMPNHGDDLGDEMVSISVGTGSKCENFTIHKKILQKTTHYFDKQLQAATGKQVNIVLKDDDPSVFQMFYDWLYIGNVEKPPTQYSVKKKPSNAEMERLESDLREKFDAMQRQLVCLYTLAEKLEIDDLQNRAIDNIQDGFHEYGTVFGPALIMMIFMQTKKDSQLRDLCVAANVIHMDRGCGKLRDELQLAGIFCEDFMPHMLTWISRNFSMFSRRHQVGYSAAKRTEGFSMLNRNNLCPCHFHKHRPGEAHKGHKKCAIPYLRCGHKDEGGAPGISDTLRALSLMGGQ